MILGSGLCSGDINCRPSARHEKYRWVEIFFLLPSFPPKTQLTELRPPSSKRRLRLGRCLFHGDLLVQELLDEHLCVVDLEFVALNKRDALMLGFVVVRQCVVAVSRPMTVWLGTEKGVRQMLADVTFEFLFPAWVLRFTARERTRCVRRG